MAMLESYRISSLDEIIAEQGNSRTAEITRIALLPECLLAIPEPDFGERPQALQDVPSAQDRCESGPLKLLSPSVYKIQNCTVWTQYGLVFWKDRLIRDSLPHFPAHLVKEISFDAEVRYAKNAVLSGPPIPIDSSIDTALSLLAGIQQNYYHWLMFVVSRLAPEVLTAIRKDGGGSPIALIPDQLFPYQNASIAPLLEFNQLDTQIVGVRTLVDVEQLYLPATFPQGGLTPNFVLKNVFEFLSKTYLRDGFQPSRKIYISRKDSKNRAILNEDDVQRCAELHGFEVVTLSGLSFADQIRLFSACTHVVAPHGAGLTNLVFCRPGTKILEIHTKGYVNWCYRRLCAVYGLQYGFLIGEGEPQSVKSVHQINYRVPIEKLARELSSRHFSG